MASREPEIKVWNKDSKLTSTHGNDDAYEYVDLVKVLEFSRIIKDAVKECREPSNRAMDINSLGLPQ